MTDPVNYQDTTIETVDRAIKDWFDKTVNARVKTPSAELSKVPVIFSSGERWSTGRTRQAFRDNNGVLILPIISVRRTNIVNDPTKMALGVQTDKIQIAVRVDGKSNAIQNLEYNKPVPWKREYPPVYNVYTIPFPDRMISTYQLVIQTQFISQMNEILQKIWRSLDIQKTFVAPFQNDGRVPPRQYQYDMSYRDVPKLDSRYVVGFMENTATDAGNFEEFTDQERIVKYNTEFTVPFVMQLSPEGTPAPVQVEQTAYKVVMKDENYHFVDNRDDLDLIFGKDR
jgi:hypothetical protein